jgi:septal ring factor EnvC (AmiA/AmiB activator)
MKLAIAAVFAALLAGCSQQATADFAVCKSDLARAQADLATAKTAQTAAEQKASGLEQQVAALNTQLTEVQDQAAKAAEEKAAHKSQPVKKKAVSSHVETPAAPVNEAPKPAPVTPATSGAQRQRVK